MRGGEASLDVLYQSETARVFRASATAERVVFKELLGPDAARRMQHEAEMLARVAGMEGLAQRAAGLHAAHLLALADYGGVSLSHVLRAGAVEMSALLRVAVLLVRAVASMHRAGVIHRDICPANIMLPEPHKPVLIDFGAAVPLGLGPDALHDGEMVGTLGYLAPEQTGRTGRAVDLRADLYALGATLYEMATGVPPFKTNDALELIHDHLVREPVTPARLDPRLPQALSDMIMRLLAKEPDRRYQSAEGLLHDLARLQGELAGGGGAAVFELGERDFAAGLAAPDRLVGRDAELQVLRTAFSDALGPQRRALLIEGAPGVGKSALVYELRPLAGAAGGRFVIGRFDPYQRAAAGAITQALRALGQLLLAENPQDSGEQVRFMRDKLGPNAALITQVAPEFAHLWGPQPQVAAADPAEAEQRLLRTLVDLLRVVASPEHPLVMVLDNLQWAGELSLRILDRLMSEPAMPGLLVVGCFRAGAPNGPDPLMPYVKRWRVQEPSPLYLALGNLPPASVAELVGLMLRLPPERAGTLARAVGALTAGNPFDTVEMVNALRSEGVLGLESRGWQWDEAAIQRFVGRSNVADLLAARIARLPAASRILLQCMSCLGAIAEYPLVQAAAGLTAQQLEEQLREPLEDGLLMVDRDAGGSIRFRHERVQQAVLGTFDEVRRGELQLVMARRLAGHPGFQTETAQQYLGCAGQLTEPDEQRAAAVRFQAIASRLASGANYAIAQRYLAAASLLLERMPRQNPASPSDAALRCAVDELRHVALYSMGRLDEADALYGVMQPRTDDPLDLLERAALQMRSLDMRGRYADSVRLGMDLLARLGVAGPERNDQAQTEGRLDAFVAWIAQDSSAHHLQRPQLRDPVLLAIAKVLNRMVRSAFYLGDSKSLLWGLLESQRLWREHGPCPALVASLGRMCTVLISARQDYRGGYAIARHVLAVGEALGYEPQTSEARIMFASYAVHWFEPLENALHQAVRAYEGVQAAGDASYSGYFYRISIQALLDCGATIALCEAEIERCMDLCRRSGNRHVAAATLCDKLLLQALRGQAVGGAAPGGEEAFDEQAFLSGTADLPLVEFTSHSRQALHALLMGDLPAFVMHAERTMALLGALESRYFGMHAHLFIALSKAWQMQGDPSAGLSGMLVELNRSREWIAARAADQPDNFLHLLRLVEAEQAWAQGDPFRAGQAFDAAMEQVQDAQRPWHQALICERAGLFHRSHGMPHAARQLLAQACDIYEAWGAGAKVQAMQRMHEFLRTRGFQAPRLEGQRQRSGAVSPDALDLMGVLRASQALSSETSLERLTAKVGEIVAAMTGATRVSVLSWNEGQWWLLAPAPGEPALSVGQAGERGLLPVSAIGYAQRTQEPLLVDDALADDRFARDVYFAGQAQCSLLLVPISSQADTRAMLYLENRLGRAAFNAQRLDAVMLIAGQLAVSLANAQLYESLEQRVQERTRELRDTQAQLVTTARKAGMAEIANNVLHNVGNVLNSVNISAGLVSAMVRESRAQGLVRAVDLMNEHAHDLGRFIGEDERGKMLPGYLGKLVAALAQERQEVTSELQRLMRSVNHIKAVVATQQSHAGAASVLEIEQAAELIDEALRMNAASMERHRVTLVKQVSDIPPLLLDRQRVLQILVNLVSNATQAMGSMPRESRTLTVGAGMVQGDKGKCLRITVRDQGEGIPVENLTRIFSHGFTTKKDGHGFGLHSSALAAIEMGGSLAAHSDGIGSGAEFTLELPADAARAGGASIRSA